VTRFAIYGVLGVSVEVFWTALAAKLFRGTPGWHLHGTSSIWMFFIYGLAAFLFEPAHDAMRGLPWWTRGAVYVAGIYCIEYASGWMLRRLLGKCPWDYTRHPFHLHGLIAWDYAPLWLIFGLGLEHVHDWLDKVLL
jgi:uncharacterized membrane protein